MNKARRKEISRLNTEITRIIEELEEVKDQEETYFDNIPENLQGGQRYEESEEAITALDDVLSSLEDVTNSLQELEG